MSITATALSVLLTAPLAAAEPPPADCITVTAQMPQAQLKLRDLWTFTVQVDVDPAWSAISAGIPGILLQFDVPESIHFEGPYIDTHEGLAKHDFLQRPFERYVRPGRTMKIRFHVDEMVPDVSVGINVIAYLRAADAEPGEGEAWFVHRRVEMPVEGYATGVPGDPAKASWSGAGLKKGDVAPGFSLPRADGTRVALEDYRGRKNVIVTTYRAFW